MKNSNPSLKSEQLYRSVCRQSFPIALLGLMLFYLGFYEWESKPLLIVSLIVMALAWFLDIQRIYFYTKKGFKNSIKAALFSWVHLSGTLLFYLIFFIFNDNLTNGWKIICIALFVASLVPYIIIDQFIAKQLRPLNYLKRTTTLKKDINIGLTGYKKFKYRALVITLSLLSFGFLNYGGFKMNKSIDLSYFKRSQVSNETKKVIEGLNQPLKITLFGQKNNEVFENTKAYLQYIQELSSQVKLNFIDRDLNIEEASQLGVKTNGNILIQSNDLKSFIYTGIHMHQAKSVLRNLDNKFLTKIGQIVFPDKKVYFIRGFGERGSVYRKDASEPLSKLRTILNSLKIETNNFGLEEGLANGIPDDADMIVIGGATKNFPNDVRQVLMNYLQNGGKVLFLLDNINGQTHNEFLGPLGFDISPSFIQRKKNLRPNFPNEGIVVQFINHPFFTQIANLVHRNNGKIMYNGANALSLNRNRLPNSQTKILARGEKGLFIDKNNNSILEKDEVINPPGILGFSELNNKGLKGKLLLVADVDMFTDKPYINLSQKTNALVLNKQLLIYSIGYLIGHEYFNKLENSEADVEILVQRNENLSWFYIPMFVLPLAVLSLGYFMVNKK